MHRVFTGLLRVLFLAGPALALAILGAFYLLACVEALAGASGSPVETRLQTPGGELTVFAKSYDFDLESGRIQLNGVVVRKPNKKVLLSVGSVTLRNWRDLISGSPRGQVALRDVAANIIRKPNGQLDFQDYLPKRKPSETESAWSVDVWRANVSFLDETADQPWSRMVTVGHAAFDGSASAWTASGRFQAQGELNGKFQLDFDQDSGLTGQAQADIFEASNLLNDLKRSQEGKRYAEIRRASASGLSGSATARWQLPPKKELDYTIQVQGRAVTGSYDQYNLRGTNINLSLTPFGVSGVVNTQIDGAIVRSKGAYGYGKENRYVGILEVASSTPNQLPRDLKRLLPKGLNFQNARFSGDVQYGKTWSLNGNLSAKRVSFAGEDVQNVAGQINLNEMASSFVVSQASIRKSNLRGGIAWSPNKINGAFQANKVDLNALAKRFEVTAARGSASLLALVSGEPKSPTWRFRATGQGVVQLPQREPIDIRSFQGEASYRNGLWKLSRFNAISPDSEVVADGTWNPAKNQLNLDVMGAGIPAKSLLENASGTGALKGKVTGNLQDPKLNARVEFYEVGIGDYQLPIAFSQLLLDRKGIKLTDAVAYSGPAKLEGNGEWDFKTGRIAGSFSGQDVELSQWLGEDYAGYLDVKNGKVQGSLKRPQISANVEGEDLLASGFRVDKATASVESDLEKTLFRDIRASVGTGVVQAQADYLTSTGEGSIDGQANALPLRRLLRQSNSDVQVSGQTSNEFRAKFANRALTEAFLKGTIGDLTINRTDFGDGRLEAAWDGKAWTGTGFVGVLERFVEVPKLRFEPESQLIDAEVIGLQMKLEDLGKTVGNYLVNAAESGGGDVVAANATRARLGTASGTLDFRVLANGSIRDPNVEVTALSGGNLKLEGEDLGSFETQAKRSAKKWTIPELNWRRGEGLLRLDRPATIEENGDLDISGEFSNVAPAWFGSVSSALERMTGTASLSFSAFGKTSGPEIRAALTGNFGAQGTADQPYELNLHTIQLREGNIGVTGLFGYRGLKGNVQANIPFLYPFTIPEDELSVLISVPERQIKDLAEYLPSIDTDKSSGSVKLNIQLGGTISQLKLNGELDLAAPELATRGVETSLKDLLAKAQFDGETLRLSGSARSSAGGTATLDASGRLDGLEQLLDGYLDPILANRLAGSFNLQNWRVAERPPQRTGTSRTIPLTPARDAKTLQLEGTVNGTVAVGGTIGQPLLTGNLNVRDLAAVLPVFPESESSPSKYLIDPQFRIQARLDDIASLKTSTGAFELYGGGTDADATISGSLSRLTASASMRVFRGMLKLPSARISLEPGGSIRVAYDAGVGGEPVARADIDLEGRTNLTALRFGNLVERYAITLQMRGNLLKEGDLQLQAQSDPPDLSQERILQLLGQADLLESLTQRAYAGIGDRRLQSALTGFALPVVFDPITERIATTLGLEYLTVEYNALEGTTLTAARALGKGLILQGRRQLLDRFGERVRYDLRLTYRLPSTRGLLRRTTFSFGADQDRPWKIAIELSFRL